VATFSNLSLNKSGTGYTLGATSGALTSDTSSTFNITSAAATKVLFTVQPVNTAATAAITPAVQVKAFDANDNLVLDAARSLREAAASQLGAALHLKKILPVASGIGGGSADAAAALRLLTRLWKTDPNIAVEVAPDLGSDVPACLLSMSARGSGAGDELDLLDDASIAGTPVLLMNPRVQLSTAQVFAGWDDVDRGPLGKWSEGRNDLELPAMNLVPQIGEVLGWLREREGANFVRMSGSGATCFALFDSEDARDAAAEAAPDHWWHLPTFLR
jgi:4-diphosphocytidyl-2-C-methyl-D-erythritol kinase